MGQEGGACLVSLMGQTDPGPTPVSHPSKTPPPPPHLQLSPDPQCNVRCLLWPEARPLSTVQSEERQCELAQLLGRALMGWNQILRLVWVLRVPSTLLFRPPRPMGKQKQFLSVYIVDVVSMHL